MSQFYEGRGVPASLRPNRPIPIERQGITESIIAPGLAVPPPAVSRTTIELQQLANILQGTGQLVGDLGRQARQDRFDLQREEAQQEEFLRGEQAQRAQEFLPGVEEQIKAGTLTPPPGVSIEDFARDYVEGVNAAPSEAERDEFRKRTTDPIIRSLYARQDVLRVQNNDALLKTLQNGAAGADAEGLGRFATAAQEKLGLTPVAAKEAIGLGAMDYAVEQARTDPVGARKAFTEAEKFLGGEFKEQTLNKRARLEAIAGAQEQQRSQDIKDNLLRMLARHPPEVAEKELNRLMVSSAISGADELAIRNAIDSKRDEIRRETTTLMVAQEKKAIQAEYDNMARAYAAERGSGGGLYNLPEEKFDLPNGTEFSPKRSETIQRIADEEVARIPDLAGQIDWVSRNGVIPTTWDRELNNAGLSASLAQLLPPKDASQGFIPPTKLPDRVSAAYDLYKSIRAINPAVASRAMKDRDTESLFDLASYAESLPNFGDPAAAMTAALRVANENRRYGQIPDFRTKDVDTAADDIGGGNKGYVASEIRRAAQFYARLGGGSDDRALEQGKEAFKKNHTKLNGNWVYTRDVIAPEAIAAAAPIVAKDYANTIGQGEGVDKGDLTLMPTGPNQWMLWRTDIDQPVEDLRSGVSVFSTQNLLDMLQKRSGMERQSKIDEAKRRVEMRRENAPKLRRQMEEALKGLPAGGL